MEMAPAMAITTYHQCQEKAAGVEWPEGGAWRDGLVIQVCFFIIITVRKLTVNRRATWERNSVIVLQTNRLESRNTLMSFHIRCLSRDSKLKAALLIAWLCQRFQNKWYLFLSTKQTSQTWEKTIRYLFSVLKHMVPRNRLLVMSQRATLNSLGLLCGAAISAPSQTHGRLVHTSVLVRG